jgi:hypothetical protein
MKNPIFDMTAPPEILSLGNRFKWGIPLAHTKIMSNFGDYGISQDANRI